MTETTVRELKIWLEQFDEDTIVEVLEKETLSQWGGDSVVVKSLDLKAYGNWDFTDFTDNEHVKEDAPYFGKKFLTLGEN